MLTPVLQTLADGLGKIDLGREWPRLREELGGTFLEEPLPPAIPGAAPRDVPAWQAISRVLLTQNGDRRKNLPPDLVSPPNSTRIIGPR